MRTISRCDSSDTETLRFVCRGKTPGRQTVSQRNFCDAESLRWHVCRANFARKIFLSYTNFLTKNVLKFPPKCLCLYSVGQKKSRKILAKFPTKFPKFPYEKIKKKFTDELLQERGGERIASEALRRNIPLSWGAHKVNLIQITCQKNVLRIANRKATATKDPRKDKKKQRNIKTPQSEVVLSFQQLPGVRSAYY